MSFEECKYFRRSEDGLIKFCLSRKMNEATGRYRCDFTCDVDRTECIFYQSVKKKEGGAMIPDGTIRIYWTKSPELVPKYKDVDIKTALAMRKDLLLFDHLIKIFVMKEKKWVTISESTGGGNYDSRIPI